MIWAFLGFSVSVIAMFCIAFAQWGADRAFFEANRLIIAAGLGMFGAVLYYIGLRREARQAKAVAQEQEEGETGKGGFKIALFSARHWGIMAVSLGVCVVYIHPWKFVREEGVLETTDLQRVKQELPTRKVTPPVPAPVLAEEAPAVQPVLKLQGVFYRESDPAAIINGKTFYVGDKVDGVEIVAIARGFITVKSGGVTTLMPLK